MPVTVMTPSKEQVDELRNRFIQKYENEHPEAEPFHPVDIDRIRQADVWCTRFLEMYDLDTEMSLEKLWETCVWRQQYGTNELHEGNIRKDYLKDGVVFTRNKDVDGKPLLIFKTKLHTKGTRDMEDMMRVVVYWIERIQRETNLEKITVVFDMAGTGIANIDLDFVMRIVDIFKLYYPNALNYILIYEMAWVLNAVFRVIKGLMPPKSLEILKVVTKKDITAYIDKENCLTSWGGSDPYEYTFDSEIVNGFNSVSTLSGVTSADVLEKSTKYATDHSIHFKKVHFSDNSMENGLLEIKGRLQKWKVLSLETYEDMLRLSPDEFLTFSKNEGGSNIEITCISKIPVTYKIQTTSPEKFRVRPRCGVLNPGETVSVGIVLKAEHQLSESSKDKFLIMCIPVPQGAELTPQEMSDVWKHKQFKSPEVEQHRLTCVYKSVEINRNGFVVAENEQLKSRENAVSDVTNLSKHTNKLEKQLRFTQILQCVTLVFLLILSAAVVYLLKLQSISPTQEDSVVESNVLGATSCPMDRRI